MREIDLDDDAPDAFTQAGECWAWKRLSSVIGGDTHTHVCRESIDEHGRHTLPHHCDKCGADF